MAKNNKYMLVPIGEFIHNTVCGRLLCFPTYIFSFLTPRYLQYLTTRIGYVILRGCASRSP